MDELLRLLGLENRKNHYSSQLSGGQHQRVFLNTIAKKVLSINLGNIISLREIQYDSNGETVLMDNYKEYKVVGFVKEQFKIDGVYFSGTTYLEKLHDNKEYNVLFTVTENKNKNKILE